MGAVSTATGAASAGSPDGVSADVPVLGGGRGTEAACRGGLRRRRLLRAVRHLVQAVVRECGERAVAGGEGHDRHGRGAAGGGRRRGGQPAEGGGRGEGGREGRADGGAGGRRERA